MANLYYEQKYKKEIDTKFISTFQKDGRNYATVEDTIFYPQGGGQKGDRGFIIICGKNYNIINTVKSPSPEYGEELLVVETMVPESIAEGEPAKCVLDWEFRYMQMKLHTCVHLHHCMIEQVAGKKVHNPDVSTIEDGFALNRYVIASIDTGILDESNNRFLDVIKSHTPVLTYPDKEKQGFRWWDCLGYKIPCGGIHVDYLDEIKISSISTNSKKGYNTIKIVL